MPGTLSPPHGLAIPTCTTARLSRTCRDACRYRLLAVSFEVGGGESVPGIPGACASPSFTYLPRGPWDSLLYTARNTVEWFAECHIINIIFTIFSDFWQNNAQLWNRERTKKIPSFGPLMFYGIIESQQTFKKWHRYPSADHLTAIRHLQVQWRPSPGLLSYAKDTLQCFCLLVSNCASIVICRQVTW